MDAGRSSRRTDRGVDGVEVTLFIVGFICGGMVIGTLVAAIMLSMGAQTDREAQEYEYFQECVRTDLDEMPASEDTSSGEVVENG